MLTMGAPANSLAAVSAAIRGLFAEAASQSRILAIGICAPGPLNPETGVIINPPNLAVWHHYPLAEEMRRLYQVPVQVDNDANAAALAEAKLGGGPWLSSANMPVRLGEDENGPGAGNQPYLRYNHQHTSVSRNSVHDKAAQLDQPVQKGQARRRRAGYQDIPVGQKGRQSRRNHDRKIRADVEPPPGILRSTGLPIRLMNVCFLDCAVCEQCASSCGKSSEARNVF